MEKLTQTSIGYFLINNLAGLETTHELEIVKKRQYKRR